MYAFVVLIALALSLSVLQQVIREVLPVRAPAALARSVAVVAGIALSWAVGYSAFAAFGQDLRLEWMHPVMTGLVLVAFGDLIRSVVRAIAHRDDEPQTATERGHTVRAA